MFKKLLNVGKGHSSSERSHHYHQQQQQQKNLFQLNEIRSYGFTHLHCLGYSATLSLLAVGSKTGLLRILGNPSVEFSYQLEAGNSIRQIEFIHCRDQSTTPSNNTKSKQQDGQQQQDQSPKSTAAKLVVLTDNGRLHLFELRNVRQLNFTDNTTQTDTLSNGADCCRSSQQQQPQQQQNSHVASQQAANEPEYTKLEYVGHLDYFIFKLDDDDRSKRVTTLEISASGQVVYVGTEGGNVYHVPVDKFEPIDEKQKSSDEQQQQQLGNSLQRETGVRQILNDVKEVIDETDNKLKAAGVDEDETTAMNLSDEPQIDQRDVDEPFEMIKFEEDVAPQLGDEIKPKKQGAIESIKKHPTSDDKILLSYHRGLSIIYDVKDKQVDKYFYHNQILESSCFASGQPGDFFYTSHNDGSYIKWDTKKGTQSKADDDYIGQLFGPYPCKPTPKIQACTGLLNDQLEELVIFSGGMPRATYDDKNPVTIVRTGKDGKDSIKVVLESTSKVLDFVVITKPRGCLGTGAKMTTGGGGKKGKNKQQQQQKQQQQHNQQIAVALAIMAEEEFVVIDLLNNESYLEFPLPYLNCVQPSAITCNQHYSDVSDELYEQLLTFSKQQMGGKLSQNGWPIQGGKVIRAPTFDSHDILLTGHEDGSVNMWDVSDLSMRHLLHVPTGRFFSTEDDDLEPINDSMENKDDSTNQQDATSAWPPLKKVGRFDPYSDDTRLAIRKISLCPQTGTLLVAGTGGK